VAKKGGLLLLVVLVNLCAAAQSVRGRVRDAMTNEVLPFATIKAVGTAIGTVADWDGKFELALQPTQTGTVKVTEIEISCLGYAVQRVPVAQEPYNILLRPLQGQLNETVIRPPYEKIRRIINTAIDHKPGNNPDHYEWYQCNIYYKMIADAANLDQFKTDTAQRIEKLRNFFEKQHLLISETFSKRTHKQPQFLHEEVLSTRFSGYKTLITNLVTDILPFHCYDDFFVLNGKEYHNPISKGFERYFDFYIQNELLEGKDTIWEFSFYPKGHKSNEIKGRVFINSSNYAISYLSAATKDTFLKQNTKIEQEYEQHYLSKNTVKWFPKHLNYVVEWEQPMKDKTFPFRITGTSVIDSVHFEEENNFKFDKAHTIVHHDNSANENMLDWFRPDSLTEKEKKTYTVIDSLGRENHFDDILKVASKLPDNKLQFGYCDVDVRQLFIYNQYEGVRLGLGLQTNDKLVKHFSVGGYAGYGFADAHWKYGGFVAMHFDKYHEFTAKAGYSDDVREPGKIALNKDLDNSYLDQYLMWRADRVQSCFMNLKKKAGYWNFELNASTENISPMYSYLFTYHGINYSQYQVSEVSIATRYAYAEKTSPVFGYYYSLGSKFPIWYNIFTYGNVLGNGLQIPYAQIVTAITYQKHINRIGNEQLLLEGGFSQSEQTLPLSKLFAANGYNYNAGDKTDPSIYTFGGMMTIIPYRFYTDKFVQLCLKHDFDWRLFVHNVPHTTLSFAPSVSLQYNALFGTLNHPEAQQLANIAVPTDGYHEAGVLLNNLVRIKYMNIAYIAVHLGYFYHIASMGDMEANGRFVFGGGIDF
jgi:Family of unknown function (DUF5686)/CarboxypepD_reg-like domain